MIRACVSCILAGLLLGATSASAAQFHAIFMNDDPDTNPGDGVCTSDPVIAICTLRAAIQEANAQPGLDTIYLSAGTYNLSITGIEEDDAATGDLDINDNLSIIGAGAGLTVINANGIDRVFHARDPSHTGTIITFTGVTITGGHTNRGAGVYADGPYVVGLSDCVVTGNWAYYAGGGLAVSGSPSPHLVGANIHGCTFDNNEAFAGAAVAADGDFFLAFRSTFAANQGEEAINATSVDLRVENCTVSGNDGMGVSYQFLDTSNPVVRIRNVTITENSEVGLAFDTSHDNGELYLSDSILAQNGYLGVENCEISGASLYSHTYNLENGDTCGLDAGAGELPMTWPALKPLGQYGGPTMTHKPEPDSPAIDAGSISCVDTDQRGVPRPLDGNGDGLARCDMGAVEVDWSLFEDGFESGGLAAWSSYQP
jgi:CSLREA domain-containing protein